MSYSVHSPRMISSPSSLEVYRGPSRALTGEERTSRRWSLMPSKSGAHPSISRPPTTLRTATNEKTPRVVVAMAIGAVQEPEVVANYPTLSLGKRATDARTKALVTTVVKRVISRKSARIRSTQSHSLFALTTPSISIQTGSHLTDKRGIRTTVLGYRRW